MHDDYYKMPTILPTTLRGWLLLANILALWALALVLLRPAPMIFMVFFYYALADEIEKVEKREEVYKVLEEL